MKKKIELDDYYYHEALDRAYIAADIIENMLIKHPVIDQHKELKKLVKKAQKCLIMAYQIVGGLEFENQNKISKHDKLK